MPDYGIFSADSHVSEPGDLWVQKDRSGVPVPGTADSSAVSATARFKTSGSMKAFHPMPLAWVLEPPRGAASRIASRKRVTRMPYPAVGIRQNA